jgi:hypothetical protein
MFRRCILSSFTRSTPFLPLTSAPAGVMMCATLATWGNRFTSISSPLGLCRSAKPRRQLHAFVR